MGMEKRGSNYVGGFLQLFDWNAKSRKKLLFSSKPDLPENSKQKKIFDGTLPTTRLQMMDVDEDGIEGVSSVKGSSDYSCASSVTDEDLCVRKGPGVVARLMGLDSMPKLNTSDPSSTTLFDCYYKTENAECRRDEEGSFNVGAKCQKVVKKPIEKFQTETLPPKSAKSIPSTHHKLLSPIKSSNFVPSKDATEIMEAAARILEPRKKTKVHTKEKAQAGQKSLRMSENSQKNGVKSGGSSVNATPMRILQDSEESSSGIKSKGRSISLALQAKANVQKREALSLNNSRTPISNAEKNESSPKMFTSQKSTRKNVLRQNNQKQNCSVDRGKSASKSANGDFSSSRRQQSCSKLVGQSKSSSRKSNSQIKDDKSSERTRKKRSADGNYLSEKNQKEVSSGESEKMETDVISFTFTAPMRTNQNCTNDSPSKRMMLSSDGMSASNFTFLARNVKGGDTLGKYLEQQLEELAHKVNFFSQQKSKHNMEDVQNYSVDQERQMVSSLFSLRDAKRSIAAQRLQGMCGRNISEEQTCLSFRFPSPVSVLERSSFMESCHSSDSTESNHSTGDSSTSAGSLAKRRSWEVDYVNKMLLCNIDQMFNDYSMGRSCELINPNLFYQLECFNHNINDCGSVSRTSRKLMFDCVSECMERRYRKHGKGGGCTLWVKGVRMLKQKDRLAQDICKEISGWSSMGDFMVDELVDRDMSSDPWLDYDVQGFEIEAKIEARILNSLIDELVADILLL